MNTTTNLRSNRNYMLLLTAAILVSPGYYIYIVAVEWLTVTLFDSRSYLGLILFSSSGARLLFMIYGGVIADRVNRKIIILSSQWMKVLSIGVLLTMYWLDMITPLFLIIVSFLFGVLDAFAGPAYDSVITSIIDKKAYQRGNALLRMANQYSLIIGPLISSTFIITIGFSGVFLFSLISIIISTTLISFIRIQSHDSSTPRKSKWRELTSSFEYIRAHRALPTLMAIGFIMNFFVTGPMGVMLPILAKDIFKGNAVVLAILEVSLGVGFILGSVIVSLRKSFARPGTVILCSLFLIVIAYTSLGYVHHLVVSMLVLFTIGVLIQVMNIPLFTYIHSSTPHHMIGKVMSIFISIVTGLTPLSYAFVAYLLHAGIGIQLVVRIFGIFLLVIVFGAMTRPALRQLSYTDSETSEQEHVQQQTLSN
ncbi:MFS transporter [Paenibacillaceae sp. P-4]|uniref:MFS transporter n=1 Tax=Paenibacillaceae bacterium P-4 TaxID=3160969 RepID=UPI0032E83DA8